jgi:hypothetical protein
MWDMLKPLPLHPREGGVIIFSLIWFLLK